MFNCFPGFPGMPPIQLNGNRAQNRESIEYNRASVNMYMWRLLDLAMSVFEWKNLPEGVDPRMLELWLLTNGVVVFFKDDSLKDKGNIAPEGYAVLPCTMDGDWNMYNYPTSVEAYSVSGYNKRFHDTDSVLIFNDYLRVPIIPTLILYSERLAEIDRAIDVNVRAQKTPKVVRCTEKQRLTFKNLAKEVDGNAYWIWGDKNIDLGDIDVLDLSAPYVSNDLQILKHQYWNEALTFLGVENVNTEKKERLVSDEVMSNMGDVEAQRFTRLNSRKWACDQINGMFGLDIDCDFRSGMYIKADGYGEQSIATTGMQSGTAGVQGAGYAMDPSEQGVAAKIRAMLGM